ncbi:MAG: hypothetical protein ACKVP0_03640 [Pirellulaceae bacterium]
MRFRAVGAVVFVAVAAEYVRLRRVYRVRFDAGTLPPLFNRLAGLGMNLSNRVKLFRAGDQWKSDDDSWTLEVDGTSAQISAQIEIAPGFTETQTWSCPDFHHRMGGVFAPQTPLISVNLLVS